ncbi:MAG: amidohydrolase, partial [Chitinophagales bacterium]
MIYFLISLLTFNPPDQTEADLIITNAKIYTVDSAFTIAEAMAVYGGRILAVGTNKFIQENYWSVNVIDLEGKFVYPGLIDPHCHFLNYGI